MGGLPRRVGVQGPIRARLAGPCLKSELNSIMFVNVTGTLQLSALGVCLLATLHCKVACLLAYLPACLTCGLVLAICRSS